MGNTCDILNKLMKRKVDATMAFVGWFVHYLLIFIVLVAMAGLGIFCGKKWSDSKEKKQAAEAENAKEN